MESSVRNAVGYAATGPKDIFWQDWDRDQAFVPALRKSGIKFSLHKHLSGSYHLEIYAQPLRDLSILKNAPISMLTLDDCLFSDLTPIHELKLEALYLKTDRVADLTPLRGMPLKTLSLAGSKFSDLSPLTGLPIKALYLHRCENVTDVAALARIPTLENVTVPLFARSIEDLRKLSRLERLGFELTGSNPDVLLPETTAEEFWKEYGANGWVSRLRASGFKPRTLTRLKDGTWHVDLNGSAIRDLTILSGVPISDLVLGETAVAELSPLRGMPLQRLTLAGTKVTDLSPLAGMPLEMLHVGGTKVTDLSCLRWMPLVDLKLHGCTDLADLSPLAEARQLTALTLPPKARDFEFLRSFPKLARLSFYVTSGNPDLTAAAFWKEYDTGWARALRESGVAIKFIKELPNGTWQVDLSNSGISDLTILSGAPISSLHLDGTPVSKLAPLRGMAIKQLTLAATKVSDLSPLKGMPLEMLHVQQAKMTDLSALQGMPLTSLRLNGCTQVTNISALRGAPLNNLTLHDCPELTDLAPLADCKSLQYLTLPPNATNFEFLRASPELERLSFKEDRRNSYHPDMTAAEFWKEYDRQAWLRTLRASGVAIKWVTQLPDGTWEVDLSNSRISDFTILKGAPISFLNVARTAGSDLTPLRGMPLKRLQLYDTKVTDLSPLEGMPLELLNLAGTRVTDLSSLRGMSLVEIRLHGCTELTDLSPLADSRTLTIVTLPPNVKDVECFRSFPMLGRISFKEDASNGHRPDKTAAEFWKEYDGQAWLRTLRASGVTIKRVKQLPDGTWEVDLSDSGISDLTILSGAPISSLDLNGTPVSNLAPLRGIALPALSLRNVKVADLSPLEGMPLESLQIVGTNVKDLAALRGMPLTSVRLFNCKELTDLSPLADCKELQNITLPPNATNIEFLRAFPRLQRIGFREDPKSRLLADKTATEFWNEYDEKNQVAGAIRDAGFTIAALTRRSDGTWEVNLTKSDIGDLKALRGLPIGGLLLGNTAATDLEPLRGMALKKLYLYNTKVTDLSPLAGMPLETLQIQGTKVTELSALLGMPLTSLRLNHCTKLTEISALRGAPLNNLTLHDCPKVTDLAPLANCKSLASLTLPPNAKNIEFLRAFPKLERIGFKDEPKNGYQPDKTAAEFWNEYDARKH
jgi:Leucine-rich repeat (LRR) protein